MQSKLIRHLFFFALLCSTQISAAQNQTLVLQPDPNCGKDATIWYMRGNNSRFNDVVNKRIGSVKHYTIMEWTWNGIGGRRWVLVDFLAGVTLPQDLEIVSAKLSLYSPPDQGTDGFHSSYAVRRRHPIGVIQQVLEPWDEYNVTWNTRPAASVRNQVVLPAPTHDREDFVDIDVTELIKTLVRNPAQNHGLLIRMQEEARYQKLVFASSDHPDPAVRPKLEIQYRGREIEIPQECGPYVDCHPQFLTFFDLNGQMTDDTFKAELPTSCELVDYNLRIFNEAGIELFHTTKANKGWDGTYKRQEQPVGNYSYFCSYRLSDSEEYQTQCGQFSLIGAR